jgi:hypothetical protein
VGNTGKNRKRLFLSSTQDWDLSETVQIKAECNRPLDLKWRQPLERLDLSPLSVSRKRTKSGDKSRRSKDSVNSRTAIILHIVDAIEI